MSMSPKVILKSNILKLCEKLLKDVTKPPKMADLESPCMHSLSNCDIYYQNIHSLNYWLETFSVMFW